MKYYKIMWLPNTTQIIWDMKTERQIRLEHEIYGFLKEEHFSISEWIDNFAFHYKKWLADESSNVYEINGSLYSEMISVLTNINSA